MSMFGKKISIEEGSKYDTSKVSSEGISKEERLEMEKKNKKLIDVFKAFDIDGSGDLNKLELAAAMDAFSRMDNDKEDGKLSKKELKQGADALNQYLESQNLNVTSKGLKAFLKSVSKLTQNDPKTETQQVLDDYIAEQTEKLKKQQQQQQTPPPAQEPKEEEQQPPQQPKSLNTYTVQEGESFTDLIKRSLESQGIENPTKEQIQEAKDKFKENNPDAVKKSKNGTEYLIVGDEVKIEGELEDKKNAEAEIKKYADKYPAQPPAPKTPPAGQEPPAGQKPPAGQEQQPPAAKKETEEINRKAKEKGLRPTYSEKYFYDEKTKKHYLWDAEKQEFRESKDTKMVYKDGSFRKETKNEDGSLRSVIYGKDGYAKTMEARTSDGKKYINEKHTAKRLGLKETFATQSEGIYYDEKTKMHYKWNPKTHQFDALNKDTRMVGKDGTKFDKDGRYREWQLKKDGTDVITYSDGSTGTNIYDANGNRTKSVYKDANGKVTGSYEYTYDADGNNTKEVKKDANGKVTGSYEYTYDADGNNTKEVQKDENGKVVCSNEYTYDADGNKTKEVYKDANGKEINYEE